MGEKLDEAKGRAKKAAGKATRNPSLTDRGRMDSASAKMKKGVSRTAKKAKKAHRRTAP
jgi:uncharacterized protein YjbJ (UPF0337 family)